MTRGPINYNNAFENHYTSNSREQNKNQISSKTLKQKQFPLDEKRGIFRRRDDHFWGV